jgi:hypothetical protein
MIKFYKRIEKIVTSSVSSRAKSIFVTSSGVEKLVTWSAVISSGVEKREPCQFECRRRRCIENQLSNFKL